MRERTRRTFFGNISITCVINSASEGKRGDSQILPYSKFEQKCELGENFTLREVYEIAITIEIEHY